MATLFALVLITLGILEFINNKRIAVIFDPEGRDLRSTARQNIMGISLVFIATGLVLLVMP